MKHITFILVFALLSCSCTRNSKLKDPFPEIVLPVYQGAIAPEEVIGQPQGTKAVVYRIQMQYPARELITFYENYFTKKRFIRYSEDDEGKCVWTTFNRKLGEREPYIMQSGDAIPERFICSWVDKNHETRILLILSVNDTGNLDVTCQVYPFFDHRDFVFDHRDIEGEEER